MPALPDYMGTYPSTRPRYGNAGGPKDFVKTSLHSQAPTPRNTTKGSRWKQGEDFERSRRARRARRAGRSMAGQRWKCSGSDSDSDSELSCTNLGRIKVSR